MNRNRYRLIFSTALGMMVPVAETARRSGKSSTGKAASGPALALAGVLLAGPAQAELPVPGAGGAIPDFVTRGQANYQVNGTQAYVNQVGNKSILNWQSFNVSAGHDVQFRQVDNLATQNLVQGANFTSLNRIYDINPSVIAGSISQAAGQKANVILVNSNGIAFMGGSQVNLNSFTASTLDIQDRFLDNFLPQGETKPQFENALDGSEGRGFVKVFEGARITAGSQGRVILIAPTVVNRGKVEAQDGQVIMAAGSKVFLRTASAYGDENVRGLLVEVDSPAGLADFETANADVKNGQIEGQTVGLTNPAEDKLGHATNLGELSTPRGNVTMVGYAVNQMGIARATTSVVANGSVYLMAKDKVPDFVATESPGSVRAGRVVLGQNSLTEILPETGDTATTQDGTAGAGLDRPSLVRVLGQDVRVEGKDENGNGGARIVAPSGVVELVAVDNPRNDFLVSNAAEDMFGGGRAASSTARLHVGDGARIDVSGLRDVEVAAGRSVIEIELRGDELKDSPVNQQGALRGQKVYLDVDRALAASDAGKPTLVARDALLNLKAQQQRTVAERSTTGGSFKVYSKGEAIVESGVTVDLSGGSLKHTPGNLKTTLLTSGGKVVDVSEASAEMRYDGIATRYVIDYGRWNRKEVIDLGQSYRYDAGFTEGKNAGSLETFGIGGLYAQPAIVGATVTGERQRELGIQPRGARWVVGYDDLTPGDSDKNRLPATGYVTQDFKLNQNVILANAAARLPEGFRAGDALPPELKSTLALDGRVLGANRVAELTVLSNQAVAVREALATPQGGALKLTGSNIDVASDIVARSGVVDLTARNTAGHLADALPAPTLTVADGATISTRGAWTNDLPGAGGRTASAPRVDGGTIRLEAQSISDSPGSFVAQGEVALGQGATLDADGGAWLKANGKTSGGNGGAIAVSGYAMSGLDGANVHAYGVDRGGSLTLGSNRIQVGGAPLAAADALDLDPALFSRGGFARFNLNALSRLEVAEGTRIAPVLVSREFDAASAVQASGGAIENFSHLAVRDDRVRQAVDVTLRARQDTAQTGSLVVGSGARIELDPRAKLVLDGLNRVDIDGLLRAQGGTIAATSDIRTTLGSNATLDVSGIARTYLDSRGLVQGTVLAGGTVDLAASSAVVAEAGSRIDVSGAAPVRLDVPNESGGLGRSVGSAGGAVKVFADGLIRLDGDLAAQGGGGALAGGRFEATLGKFVEPGTGAALAPAILSLAPDVAPGQTDGATRISADRLERAGFDRIKLSSRDAIRLENGLDVGAGRALPLRELTLDAAAILTAGGDSTVRADTLTVGNLDSKRRAATTATGATGTLALDARLLDLVGQFEFSGMSQANLTGREAIRFSGTTPGTGRPAAELRSGADLTFHGAVVAPASYTQARIVAPGRTVAFTRTTDAPVQPLAALGSLAVEAKDIAQGGNLWAPLGQLDFKASETLTFTPGSLTSVAAAPGSILPFGKTQNGREWVVDLDPAKVPEGQIKQDDLAGKSVRVSARTLDMQPGAKVDLSGGGDLQAYEFTVGPGGSRDILADAETYAILPGFQGGFAPTDAQEKFDRASGEAVFLSGVPGLADGVYTLLPAHYALLPDAYAVKLGAGNVLPGQAFTRQDGVRVAAGYLTDTRAGAPRDAAWQGIQVLTRDQVRARSEFTLTRASDFFSGSFNRPQDAGLLSVATIGTGADTLKLDAIYNFAAAPGGRGAKVDISARKLAVVSGTPAGLDPDAVVLDAAALNALGADSLLLGGARETSGNTTTLTVGADEVTLANDVATALTGSDVMLAAKDTLTLKAGSRIDAQGASGDAGQIETAGNGAFVRAASTTASFSRTASPDRSAGTLSGEAGSVVAAADSIVLDATKENAFKGVTQFSRNGTPVAGNLAIGARRINLGAAPVGSAGFTLTQPELDALDLAGLALTSYSTVDLYGDVRVGQRAADGKPLLKNLTLQGAGLAGIVNAGTTAEINAQNLTLANSAGSAFEPGGALGSGDLEVNVDTLTLGAGDKAIRGFGAVSADANELVGQDKGSLTVDAPLTLTIARVRGEVRADQAIDSKRALVVASRAADRALAPVTALGAKWAFKGTTLDFDSHAELPSGSFKLAASSGDVTLGANARVDVAGREVQFFDVKKPSWGGTAEFVSETGNVTFANRALRDIDLIDIAQVDVSAAAGGDGGTLIVRAADGSFTAANGSVKGQALADASGARGEGARVEIDVKTLASFSALNTALNGPGRLVEGVSLYDGFDGARSLRVRTGDVSIAGTDSVRAQDIRIAADGGKLDVRGTLDASGADAGRIEFFAKGDVNVLGKDDAKGLPGAKLLAQSSGAGEDGGDIVIGTREGSLNLATDSDINVSAESGGQGGTVLLRASRNSDNTDVAVNPVKSTITGARSIVVEAVKEYENKTTLDTSSVNSGSTLGLGAINADNTAFATKHASIKTRLDRSDIQILSGVEVRSTGDLTLGADWNLAPAPATARAGGEAGVLTLRADGNLLVGANLSDGFSHATPCTAGACTATGTPATLRSDASWSYRLIAGADSAAADPLAVKAVDKDVTLAAGKLIRTGTGDIDIAAGRNVVLVSADAAIYTAGRLAAPLPGFTLPFANLRPAYTVDGGDVRIAARGDVVGKPSAQLFSQWLYRQGAIDPVTGLYVQQPAWWVRFDQFRQGVGALGGGDVTVAAGGKVQDISASLPTQAYTVGTKPSDAVLKETGGGTLRATAGGDVLGGSYYIGRGELDIRAGGRVAAGSEKINTNTAPLAAIMAVGDAQADVRATGDVVIGNIVNPHLVPQSAGNLVQPPFGQGLRNPRATLFSTYGDGSGVTAQSLAGNTRLENGPLNSSAFPDLLGGNLVGDQTTLASGWLPPTLSLVAFLGDVTVGTAATGNLTLSPSASGTIDLFAGSSIRLNSNLTLSDMDPRFVPDATHPVGTVSASSTARPVVPSLLLDPFAVLGNIHAPTPVHAADRTPVRVYAREGDVVGVNSSGQGKVLNMAKAVDIRAGNDVRNLSVFAQHSDAADTSRIVAGRDVVYDSTSDRRDRSLIRIGGAGRVEITAGRDIDLGTSGGIQSRGNIDNPNLPAGGADIHLAAGVGAGGLDYAGALARLLTALQADPADQTLLWQARWLAGDDSLDATGAVAAVRTVRQLDSEGVRERVRAWQFTALRETGRQANQPGHAFAGDFSRGYAALALLFPSIEEKNPDGSFRHYDGDINLFASRVKTENGGDIEFFVPGGDVIVGLPNTPAALVDVGSNVLGMVVAAEGGIQGMAREDMRVNQSRILTVGGGDVLLWSSEGDIDAGKGKKTASAVPPPVVKVDAQGNVTLEQQGAVTGSGIGALFIAGGIAGDVDLIAPKGAVNAGDAGIRAGNLNIAAQVVLGADNISVSGSSTGTPVADTSAVTAASSGASNAGGDVSSTTAALSQNLADAARAAEELKQAFKPTFISAEVIGHGE